MGVSIGVDLKGAEVAGRAMERAGDGATGEAMGGEVGEATGGAAVVAEKMSASRGMSSYRLVFKVISRSSLRFENHVTGRSPFLVVRFFSLSVC